MKKIITIIAFLILGFATTETKAQSKKVDQFKVQVDGLGCPFCAFGLEKKFKEFKGIKKVRIDIETGVFTFQYPSNKNLTLETVHKQVEKAGYTPITSEIIRANGAIETSKRKETIITKNSKIEDVSFIVAGNCGMCEARIEKAAKDIKGVVAAAWDKDTKLIKLQFDSKLTSQEAIEKAIAKAGHDTKNIKATSETYNGLPGCCLYERIN